MSTLENLFSELVSNGVTRKERDYAKTTICDTVAVAVAATRDARSKTLLDTMATSDRVQKGYSPLLGTGAWAHPVDAALHFGFCAHLLDFDDDETEMAMAHLSAPSLGAAYAVANRAQVGLDHDSLVESYIAGCKAMVVIGSAWNPKMHAKGWHPTSVLGIFGAAMAAAKGMELSADQTVQAMRLAASLASGGRGAFGGMGKPLQVGQAAASGLRCALLAQADWLASPGAITGGKGLGVSLSGEFPQKEPEEPESFPPDGFVTKIFPSCTATHAAVQLALDLRKQHTVQEIEQVECCLDPGAIKILQEEMPSTGDEARFSLAYCVSFAIVHGKLGLSAFGPGAFSKGDSSDPSVRDLMERIVIVPTDDLPKGPSGIATGAHLQIKSVNGSVDRATRIAAPGSTSQPTSTAELDSKWTDCLSQVSGPKHAERLLPLLKAASRVDGITKLNDALREINANGQVT
ncbi:MAG: MmgE/PrpD family protein [Planctomycetales bacterium]|nr:MmgE/PrpD family protein [Planctomycetales bacterium]